MYSKIILYLLILLAFINPAKAQNQTVRMHVHNDYQQSVPFWGAYSNQASSIEADIFLKDGQLYVAHEKHEISPERTLQNLYLEPLKKAYTQNLGQQQKLQLLIDIKSDAYQTLAQLIKQLNAYPELIHNEKLSFVISGSRPKATEYTGYPDFIQFDHQDLNDMPKEAWQKVALISLDYKDFTVWNGKGRFVEQELENVKAAIAKAHAYGKLFRFWGTPDSKSAWEAMVRLGVDYINTDQPAKCFAYISTLKNRTYTNTVFSEVYRPTYSSDGADQKAENVILLIGDGNGLSQVSSAVLANGGALTLTQLRHIGLVKTSSADDLTTDSGAGGTAYATGKKTNNRYIGVDHEGNASPNLPERVAKHGMISGIITTDEVTGATPSAFYAHRRDRGMTEEIAGDLLKSEISFFAGGGKNQFDLPQLQKAFDLTDNLSDIANSKSNRLGYFLADGEVTSVLGGRKDSLALLTKQALGFLSSKKKPFFLMVESSHIDTYGHHNNTGGIVSEGIDFDRAITEAIKYADTHKNTLVIITADHETGGFSIPHGDLATHRIEGDFTTHDHSATMVPVFAYGPGADFFTGVYENNELFHKILQALHIKK